MKGFDAKFIEELKNKNDIIDVASKYVGLEQRGTNYWGRCPFHHEKTASFCINSIGQYYYCFGCHKSGDVISLIMELESLDFNDAVKYLAERAKIPLPEFKYDDEKVKEQKRKKERVLALLKDAAKYYCSLFRSGKCPEYVDYAFKRGLTDTTLIKFGIGASNDYHGLVNYLKSKGYTYEEMTESGAVGCSSKNGRENYYDALANRLIIPVIDQFNNVVAFCGRIIDNRKDVGKYVNTKETCVFTKGKTLFNINNLKKLKNEKGLDSIIMVEGHMDVISMVQGGIENVVASMGTALTKDQARMLKRYADKVFISYDDDFAGQKATIRGLDILTEEGLDVKIVSLPDGMDPDDVLRTYGADGYRKRLNSAMPLIDFKLHVLEKTFDINTVDGKRKFTSAAIRVIRESASATEQEDLLKILRDKTGFTFDSLKRELYSDEPVKQPENNRIKAEFTDDAGDKITMAARFVLYAILSGKEYATELDVGSIEFSDPAHIAAAEYIKECEKIGKTPRISDLYEVAGDSDAGEIGRIAGLDIGSGEKGFDEKQYFYDCVNSIRVYDINKKTERLTGLFTEETDVEKRRELAKELNALLAEKNRITS